MGWAHPARSPLSPPESSWWRWIPRRAAFSWGACKGMRHAYHPAFFCLAACFPLRRASFLTWLDSTYREVLEPARLTPSAHLAPHSCTCIICPPQTGSWSVKAPLPACSAVYDGVGDLWYSRRQADGSCGAVTVCRGGLEGAACQQVGGAVGGWSGNIATPSRSQRFHARGCINGMEWNGIFQPAVGS